MTGALLRAEGLVLRHGGLAAVDHVDLQAQPGLVTAIIGPNGAGKTSLFDCLSGTQRPQGGTVFLGGRPVGHLPADERSRLGLARTFQRSSVFSSLTVAENLMVGAENRRRQGTLRSFLGLPDRGAARATAMVGHVLAQLDIRELRDVVAGELPTGTLRIIELGRALCAEPVALLLDEPASGLDDDEVARFRDLVKTLAGTGLSVLLVEHDIDLVQEVADVVYAMVGGRILASGSPAEVVARGDVRRAVLGMAT